MEKNIRWLGSNTQLRFNERWLYYSEIDVILNKVGCVQAKLSGRNQGAINHLFGFLLQVSVHLLPH